MLYIRELREARKLTQDEVVKRSGITKRSLYNLETGRTQASRISKVRVAHALGLTVFDLARKPQA
jgi:transcriptional regulator with XRE-family HTH domain